MLTDKLNTFRWILGSQSPRRQLLLRGLGLQFEVISKPFAESYPPQLKREQIPDFLCRQKSEAYADLLKNENTAVITADTIVWIDGMNLGKPVDKDDAMRILTILSGRMHEVITGVSLRSTEKHTVFTEVSEVYFRHLDQSEIEFYVDQYQPYDKAGAYGIQEWIGYTAITHIRGCFYNVMGLPAHRVWKALQEFIAP